MSGPKSLLHFIRATPKFFLLLFIDLFDSRNLQKAAQNKKRKPKRKKEFREPDFKKTFNEFRFDHNNLALQKFYAFETMFMIL